MREPYQYCPICGSVLKTGVIEGKERKFCPSCAFVDYKNPLPVAVAITVKGKKFLLIKRGLAPRKGAWGNPSGFIEVGETPEEASLRELKEEAGVSGQVVRLVNTFRVEDKEVYGDMLVVAYLIKAGDEEITPGDEVEDARFFDIAELPDYFARRHSDIIELIRNGFEVLVDLGYPPELAYFEACNEAKLIIDQIFKGGVMGMLNAVSDTAKYGGIKIGPKIIDEHVKQNMIEAAKRVQNGEFAEEWIKENKEGRPTMNKLMEKWREHQLETIGKTIRAMYTHSQ